MFSVGETLRRARLEQGLELSAVEAQTKISARYLKAIESDDRKALPSAFFYRSFVAQYALTLSLDTKEIEAEVERVLSAEAPLPLPGIQDEYVRSVAPLRVKPRFRSGRLYVSFVTLALVVVGCSGVYVWYKERRSAPAKTANSAAASVAARVRPSDLKPAAPAPSAGPAVQAASEPPATPAAAPAPVAAEVTPSEAAAAGYKVLLDLIAREETWLSVSSDGKPVFSGILEPNQTKTIEGKQFAKVRVGNAAGLEVRLNGKSLGPLGARGQVLVVVFTPDKFQIVPPGKESD